MSVLLPVRDAGEPLDACLDSLAAQSLREHELVAVDDGSRDGSGERLLARARRDPRVRVLRSPPRGIAAALNLALGEARAPLVARMDADDLAHPERLRLSAEPLEREPSLFAVACGVVVQALPGARAGPGMAAYAAWVNGLADHDAMRRNRFVEAPLVHPSVTMRRDALRGLGGYRDFDGPEDYDLWLRAFDAGLRFARVAEVLLAWRDSPARLTRSSPRYAPERFLALKVEALLRGPLRGRRAVVWGAGPLGKALARALVAAGQPLAYFVEVDPGKIGQRIHGAPVVAVPEARLDPTALHLAAVGQPGARERIRAEAARLGLVDGRDLFAVA